MTPGSAASASSLDSFVHLPQSFVLHGAPHWHQRLCAVVAAVGSSKNSAAAATLPYGYRPTRTSEAVPMPQHHAMQSHLKAWYRQDEDNDD